MIKWAGWIITLYGAAHTLGALTVEKAGSHVGAWFGGALWRDDLAGMSPANSAYWLSLASFGPPLILLGLTVLWMDRRGITPPSFIAWALLALTLVGAVVLFLTPWPVILFASVLLLVGVRRAARRGDPVPHAGTTQTPRGPAY
ncbi:DUF6463 family protein [Streptomyces sp. NPDC037389]|uniref:DUF6463 family protein n=1 Tax=Streptomyces sp. NPDC037389 TaxID=3155369 RepID=UPI0033DC8609